MTTPTKAELSRSRQRAIVAESPALVDLLNELYSPKDLPPLTGNDREIGAWIGTRKLVEFLNQLREEASGADKIPGGSA